MSVQQMWTQSRIVPVCFLFRCSWIALVLLWYAIETLHGVQTTFFCCDHLKYSHTFEALGLLKRLHWTSFRNKVRLCGSRHDFFKLERLLEPTNDSTKNDWRHARSNYVVILKKNICYNELKRFRNRKGKFIKLLFFNIFLYNLIK